MKKIFVLFCIFILNGCDIGVQSYPSEKYNCSPKLADKRAKFIMDCVKEMQIKFPACESASARIFCDEIPEQTKTTNQTGTTEKND